MKTEFLLDPEIAYLNHGSFGACPRPVFEAYQRYQRELEREPVDVLQRHFREKMQGARAALAGFLGCGGDELVFVRNANYVGNCHKWLLSPKGAGFVYAAPDQVDRVRPPIVGWGNISEGSSALLLENEWQGTSDISAFLAVADAIAFLKERDWFGTVVSRCAGVLKESDAMLREVTGQEPIYGSPEMHAPQMAAFQLPPGGYASLHADLHAQFGVEIPVFANRRGEFFRVSVQAYNSADDLQRLADALRVLL